MQSDVCEIREGVKRSIKDIPKEYASFVRFLKTPQEKRSWELVSYAIPEGLHKEAIQDFEKIQKNLPPKFTFSDLLKIATDNQCIINMTDSVEYTCGIPLWISVTLSYILGNYAGKRVLFDRFDYKIGGTEANDEI